MTKFLKNTSVLLLVFMIFSCSNDEEIGTTKSDPVISQLQNSLHLDKFTDQNISENIEVNWNDVKKTTANGIEIYEVGVVEKTPTTLESKIFQDKLKYEIIAVKNGNDISSYFIQAYSSLNHDLFPSTIKSLNNFTGTFKVFDLSGKPVDQLVVYNGKSVNPSKNPDLNLLTTAINSFYISKNLTSKVPECNAYIAYYTEMWEATYRVWRMADSGKFITMTFVGEKYLGTKVTYMATPYACDAGGDSFYMLERHSKYITTLVPYKIDPCTTGDIVTSLSQSAGYLTALNNVKSANSTVEHSITLGRDANGNITEAPMNNGGPVKVEINTNWPDAFGAIHNHPNNTPISAGDIYTAITINSNNIDFTTTFVSTDGEVYAAVVTDLEAAKAFATNYPADITPQYNPEFPDYIYNQLLDLRLKMGESISGRTMAIAFILNKFNAGITFLKQDSSGKFNPLQIEETTRSNGDIAYILKPCN
jgi:hypothetical protein